LLQSIELIINNEKRRVHVRSADTLLNVLREKLGLTGAKPGCENGDCGACTVLYDRRPMKSCLVLAMESENHDIITIEGLKQTSIQKAFIDEFAFQCGYCTSGFIMNCYALAEQQPNPDEYQIKNWLQSNICRCTGYEEIQQAITKVVKQQNIKRQSN